MKKSISHPITLLAFSTALLAIFLTMTTSCQKTPKPDFTYSGEANIYTKITFTNNTANGDHYHWDFGDGTTSEEKEPAHQYTTAGKFTVTLTAYSKNGKKDKVSTQTIDVNRWKIVGLDFGFGGNPFSWGDSTGCFEPTCDTLSARINFYPGVATTPVYTTPIMPMGSLSTTSGQATLATPVYFTNENWKLTFLHEHPSGAGQIYAEYNFNPVTTLDNGYSNGHHEHYIAFNSGNVNVSLTIYFDKIPY